MAITKTIPVFSGDPPDLYDPVNFEQRAAPFVTEMADLPPAINEFSAQANALASEINANVGLTQAYAAVCENAVAAVVSQGTPAPYNPATSYAQWATCIGSNGIVYRRIATGSASGIDPVTDLTGAWVSLNPDPKLVEAMLFGNGVYPGWNSAAKASDGASAPSDPSQPDCIIWSRGVERYKMAFTWGTSGGAIACPTTATLSRSVNSGSSYSSIGSDDVITITYSDGGDFLSAAWS